MAPQCFAGSLNTAPHHATLGYLAIDLDAVMPGPHLVSPLLKRWAADTLHYRLSGAYLPHYLDEFTLRFHRTAPRCPRHLRQRATRCRAVVDTH